VLTAWKVHFAAHAAASSSPDDSGARRERADAADDVVDDATGRGRAAAGAPIICVTLQAVGLGCDDAADGASPASPVRAPARASSLTTPVARHGEAPSVGLSTPPPLPAAAPPPPAAAGRRTRAELHQFEGTLSFDEYAATAALAKVMTHSES